MSPRCSCLDHQRHYAEQRARRRARWNRRRMAVVTIVCWSAIWTIAGCIAWPLMETPTTIPAGAVIGAWRGWSVASRLGLWRDAEVQP